MRVFQALVASSAPKRELVMRIALACGLCLLAFAAAAAPRAKDEAKSEAKNQSTTVTTRENYRARLNENVVTIMAGSASGTDLAIVQDIAECSMTAVSSACCPWSARALSRTSRT